MPCVEDRSRLMKEYSSGQSPVMAVLKCAAGVAVLSAVAAGPWVILGSDGLGIGDAGQRIAAAVASSMAESRRVFEERRQRFKDARESTKAALVK